jgi:hypothetical protein
MGYGKPAIALLKSEYGRFFGRVRFSAHLPAKNLPVMAPRTAAGTIPSGLAVP